MPAAIKTATLGCKVNQYETEFVREGLLRAGYRDANADEVAALCVVNTCTVTNEGDAKSRQLIRRMARDNPGTRIVVMGCYATRAPEEVASLPAVAEVVTDKRELPDLLGRFGVADIPTGISEFGGRHRAYVKVQDGCLLRCSYCIIPHVRPQFASRPVAPILDEVRRLVDNGYREIVLTGIHLGHFGVDWNRGKPKRDWYRLSHLVESMLAVPGNFRIRLSSIEATEVTRELLETMRAWPNRVCPHLHVCLQSGSDAILRKMKRRWGARRFVDRCNLINETLDTPALTTDVIVGFPGETDADFQATLNVVREVGFSKVHVFPFSPRRGTAAATMDAQIPKSVRTDRGRELARLADGLRQNYFDRLSGKQLGVLLEAPAGDDRVGMIGTSCRYAPVEIGGEAGQSGELISVRINAAHNDRLLATRIR